MGEEASATRALPDLGDIVQGIVRSLGGAIDLTSEPDNGSTFKVSLPCMDTTAARGCMVSAVKEFAASTQNSAVLVVEDEDNFANLSKQTVAGLFPHNLARDTAYDKIE